MTDDGSGKRRGNRFPLLIPFPFLILFISVDDNNGKSGIDNGWLDWNVREQLLSPLQFSHSSISTST